MAEKWGEDITFVCDVGYNVTDSVMSSCDADFNSKSMLSVSYCFESRGNVY